MMMMMEETHYQEQKPQQRRRCSIRLKEESLSSLSMTIVRRPPQVMTMTMMMICVIVLQQQQVVQGQTTNTGNYDQFTYGATDTSNPNNKIYGPEDWINIRCPDLDQCMGWPDGWETGIEWEIEGNTCRHCPISGGHNCGQHHMSPINLERNRAIPNHTEWKECIDKHWMSYHDSSCSFDELVEKDAFTIERHALKISQPVIHEGNDIYKLDCRRSTFGRIDFSKGFSQWWHHSHTDIHVPSEHTQEGKRYDGEIHLYHFYSVSAEDAGAGDDIVHNEMASVTMFLEVYDNVPDYEVLNKVICQWRRVEEQTREECNLPSITTEYPGCFYYTRGHTNDDTTISPLYHNHRHMQQEQEQEQDQQTQQDRKLLRHHHQQPSKQQQDSQAQMKEAEQERQQQQKQQQRRPRRQLGEPRNVHDIIMHNYYGEQQRAINSTAEFQPKKLRMEPHNFEPEDPDYDWDAFIASVYEQDEINRKIRENIDGHGHRRLINYDHIPWFNYFPLIGVRTEYYYRYSGSQTIPPCYGKWHAGTREGTNHWRVMKDPIRVSQRQINELHRLLKERIAPKTDPLRSCQKDTAGRPYDNDTTKINVTRPLQSFHNLHHKTFCECQDWRSKWNEDVEWCRIKDIHERFYKHPYNFKTNTF